MSITITKSGAALGARSEGGDLTRERDDATFSAVRRALYEHELVYFGGAGRSDEYHLRFSARFGELCRPEPNQLHANHPELWVVSMHCTTVINGR